MISDSAAQIKAFVRDSNRIEGITRAPLKREVEATAEFLDGALYYRSVIALQSVYAPGMPIRDREGMNVRVGRYVAPTGGPYISDRLKDLLGRDIVDGALSPWDAHCRFQTLHPFMDGNGRTGRAIWAWHMISIGQNPFALPFLHRFYYQTLEAYHG